MRVFSPRQEEEKRTRMAARLAWGTPPNVLPKNSPIRSSSAAPHSFPLPMLRNSDSLPTIIPAGVLSKDLPLSPQVSTISNGVAKPYEQAAIEERSSLKRQVKELERALKKSTARLERERKEHEVYKQEVIERTYETEESRKKWQAEVEKQLNRVKAEAQKKLSTALSSSNAEMEKEKSDLALLQEQARKKAAEEKGKRVELLRRQIVRRIMHRDISRGWTAWHTKWAEKVRRKRMLAQATARLTRPGLVKCIFRWKEGWEIGEQKKKLQAIRLEQRRREAELKGGASGAKEEMDKMREDFEKRLKAADDEKRELADQLAKFDGGRAAAELAHKEQLEKERQKRVEHLVQMIARRIMKKDLTRGWTTWHEKWAEKVKRMRQIAKAASRMRNPEVVEAYRIWKSFSAELKQAKEERKRQSAFNARETALAEKAKALDAELSRERAANEKKLLQAQAAYNSVMERLRLLDGDAADKERRLQEQMANEQAEREKRVEHLSQMIARRIMKKDLARGWSAWFEMWEEKVRRMRQLQHASSRLKNPELAEAFGYWVELREARRAAIAEQQKRNMEEAVAAREAELTGGVAGLQGQLAQSEKKLEAAEATIKMLTERITELDGGSMAAELAHKEQLAREKEKRVEHLCGTIAKRIMKKDLARGWTAWHEKWAEEARRKRMLAAAATRLSKPGLSRCFVHWQQDWEYAEAVKEAEAKKERARIAREKMAAMDGFAAELQASIEREKAESARKLKAAQEKYNSLFARLQEVDGGAAEKERLLQEQIAKEAADKEKRVEHLCGMIARRIMKRDLARGWAAWYDEWEEKARRKRMLAAATSRLKNPGVPMAMAHWKQDWEYAMAVKEAEAKKRRREAARARDAQKDGLASDLQATLDRERAQFASKLKASQDAYASVMARLQEVDGDAAEKERKLQAQIEHEAAEKEKRVEHLCGMIARRIMKRDLSRGFTAWVDKWEEEARRKQMLQHACASLKNPELSEGFSIWRYLWENTVEKLRKNKEEAAAAREAELTRGKTDLDLELSRMKSEYERKLTASQAAYNSVMQRLQKVDGAAAEAESKLQAQMKKEVEDREKRVEHLSQMIARRILKKDLARGWTAWYEMWEDLVRRKRMIAHACASLKNPDLCEGFRLWKDFVMIRQILIAEKTQRALEDAQKQREAELAGGADKAKAELQKAQKGQEKKLNEMQAELERAKKNSERDKQAYVDSELGRQKKEYEKKLAEAKETQDRLISKLGELDKGAAEKEKMLQMAKEDAEKEKEKRVEHLVQMIAKRIMKKDLARGWTAWFDKWEEDSRQKRMLAAATSRLKNPGLPRCFSHWQQDWEYAMKVKEMEVRKERARRQREKDAEKDGFAAELQASLDREKAEFARKLQASNDKYNSVMERLMSIDADAADKERRLQAEKDAREAEKEKRVEHLCGMIARRIMKKDLSRGFTGWVEHWAEEARRKRMIAHACASLKNPELNEAFTIWSEVIYLEKEAAKERDRRAKQNAQLAELGAAAGGAKSQLDTVTKDFEKKLALKQADYDRVLAQLAQLDGGVAAKELALQEQLAKEAADKEKRVEHLAQMIAKRIMKKDLSRGWTAWYEKWEDDSRRERMLKNAAARLTKPGLPIALAHWKQDWEYAMAEAAEQETAEKIAALGATGGELRAQLADMQRKLREAERDKSLALENQLKELLGETDAAAAKAAEAEKQERIELLYRQIGRRMMYAGVTRGFTSWVELWQERVHIIRCMSRAAGRLQKPALGGAFGWWVYMWEDEKRQAKDAKLQAQKAAVEEALRKQQLETGKLSMMNIANTDELKALKAKVQMLGEDVEGKRVALLSAADEALQIPKLQELQKVTSDALALAEKERDEAIKHAAAEQANSKQLLSQLLEEQRQTMEDEVASAKQEKSRLTRELKQARDEIEALDKELNKMKLAQKAKEKPKPKAGLTLSGEGPLSEQLAEALKKSSGRVLDLFRSWDTDGDGEVSRAEFHKAIPALGLEVPKEDVEKLFNEWDGGGDGALAYKELKRILSGLPPLKKKGLTLSGNGPLSEQLAEALRSNAARVLDLFRSWDANGDGEVSRAEFHKAVPALGLEVPKADVEELFNSWDKDGGGSLAYKELKKILSQTARPAEGLKKTAQVVTAVNSVKKLNAAANAAKMLKGAAAGGGGGEEGS